MMSSDDNQKDQKNDSNTAVTNSPPTVDQIKPKVRELCEKQLGRMINAPKNIRRFQANGETIDFYFPEDPASAILSKELNTQIIVHEFRLHLHGARPGPAGNEDRAQFQSTNGYHFGRAWIKWSIGTEGEVQTEELTRDQVHVQLETYLAHMYGSGRESKQQMTLEQLIDLITSTEPTPKYHTDYKVTTFDWNAMEDQIRASLKEDGSLSVKYTIGGSKVSLNAESLARIQDVVSAKLNLKNSSDKKT
ncbi:hypothetical protein [Marinoscillum sp.]|uniref:hypothetical protein n=1 Tax=Marinoscillum sp. TaxID=2024838 RepID=UPI003BA9C21A